MKTTIFREERLTDSMDDKGVEDPRVCGAGRHREGLGEMGSGLGGGKWQSCLSG